MRDQLALMITWIDIFATIKLIFLSFGVNIWSYNEENDKLKTAINLLILENNTLKEQIKLLLPTKTDKIFKKRKSDLLYTLNVKKAVGKPETLKKYNIIFDENLKKYI